jgi:hypothetical protein
MELHSTCPVQRGIVENYETAGKAWAVTGKKGFLQLLQDEKEQRWHFCRLCNKECTEGSHLECRSHKERLQQWWLAIDNGGSPWKPKTCGGMLHPAFEANSYADLVPPFDQEDVRGEGDEYEGQGNLDKDVERKVSERLTEWKLENLATRIAKLEEALATSAASIASLQETVATPMPLSTTELWPSGILGFGPCNLGFGTPWPAHSFGKGRPQYGGRLSPDANWPSTPSSSSATR